MSYIYEVRCERHGSVRERIYFDSLERIVDYFDKLIFLYKKDLEKGNVDVINGILIINWIFEDKYTVYKVTLNPSREGISRCKYLPLTKICNYIYEKNMENND